MAARKPSVAAMAVETSMTAVITLMRPPRTAASLPSTLAGMPTRVNTVAMSVALQSGPPPGLRPWAKTRKTTIHERAANSSKLCTV